LIIEGQNMTEIHGFRLLDQRDIAEINSHARLFEHIKTGARLLSLENDDENKAFMVGFKTPPPDDTGVPHIMEHSVLNGSRKYPVKDPFKQMLKTSLNTFLNAMTGSDRTVYPVASTNLKDFYNLVDVYFDAVFFPLISEQTLLQEGWHYETNGDGELIFKGVVFNEMKAAYSSPDRAFGELVDRTLMPDTPYANSSGGDPAAIPNLTYQQFKSFHETYYHPSNSFIFFSGDDDPDTRLRITDEVLSQFDRQEVEADMPLQALFNEPVTVTGGYDAGDESPDSKKTMIAVSWLLPEITDLQTMLDLSVMSYSLVSTEASPLRKVLLDSGLGEGLLGGGLGGGARQFSFSIGLKNIYHSDSKKVENLVLETIGNIAEEGIERDTIAAALNTFEFSLRERNTGSFPRGLSTIMGVFRSWIYGIDPLEAMAFGKRLEVTKARFAQNDDYFEQLIGTYLLNNPHRATVILRPDPEVGPKRDASELERLAQIRAAMDDEAFEQIRTIQEELKLMQETPDTPENLAKIPALTLGDIERNIKTELQEIIEQDGTRIYFHEQPTAGIAYLDVLLNLRTLPAAYLPYVELFGEALTKMGTTSESYVKLTQRIGIHTGGVYTSSLTTNHRHTDDYMAYLMLRGKAMADKTQDLLGIFKDILLTVNLNDRERFKQLVLQRKTRIERALPFSGHSIAASRVQAQLDIVSWVDEQMGGAESLFFLRELESKIDNDWASVLHALETVRDTLVNRSGMVVNGTMEGAMWHNFKPQLDDFLLTLPNAATAFADWQLNGGASYEGLTMPVQVNFNAKSANIYNMGYVLHGSNSVILKHLRREYLWEKIRVRGGAYGGSVNFSVGSGLLTYMSWRDPNITGTLHNFDAAADYLQAINLSDSDMEKAIIGAIGDLDSHDLPDAKGFKSMLRHMVGYTDAMRQQYRDEVLTTTLADFRKFGAVIKPVATIGRVAVVGSPDAIATASSEMDTQFNIIKLQ
jgi:Zn-dependent M16 (insulinase) family peptidase